MILPRGICVDFLAKLSFLWHGSSVACRVAFLLGGNSVACRGSGAPFGYWAEKPPSMTSSLPVTKEDSSEAK